MTQELITRKRRPEALREGEVVWIGGRVGTVEQVVPFMGAHEVVVRRSNGNSACYSVRGLVDVFKLSLS